MLGGVEGIIARAKTFSWWLILMKTVHGLRSLEILSLFLNSFLSTGVFYPSTRKVAFQVSRKSYNLSCNDNQFFELSLLILRNVISSLCNKNLYFVQEINVTFLLIKWISWNPHCETTFFPYGADNRSI